MAIKTRLGGRNDDSNKGFESYENEEWRKKIPIIDKYYNGIMDKKTCVEFRTLYSGDNDNWEDYLKMNGICCCNLIPAIAVYATVHIGKTEVNGEVANAVEKPNLNIAYIIELQHRKLVQIEVGGDMLGVSDSQRLSIVDLNEIDLRGIIDLLRVTNNLKWAIINSIKYVDSHTEDLISKTKNAIIYDIEIHPEKDYDFMDKYLKQFDRKENTNGN